jgi:uncharacterized protein YerC
MNSSEELASLRQVCTELKALQILTKKKNVEATENREETIKNIGEQENSQIAAISALKRALKHDYMGTLRKYFGKETYEDILSLLDELEKKYER